MYTHTCVYVNSIIFILKYILKFSFKKISIILFNKL